MPEPVGTAVEAEAGGVSRSAVPRTFIERTRQALAELMARRLDDVRLAVLTLGGTELTGRTNVVALAINTEGVKIHSGSGRARSRTVAMALLANLVERGLSHDATAWRVIDAIDGRLPDIRATRAGARERRWSAGARPPEIVLGIDATLITAHSDTEGRPSYKRGYGDHPMLRCLGAEALAGILRPGDAGANTVPTTSACLVDALDQLREDKDTKILVRAHSAGCMHGFLDAVVETGSVGVAIDERARQAILAPSASACAPAIRQDAPSARAPGWPSSAILTYRAGPPDRGGPAAESAPPRAPSSPSATPMATASRCC